MSEILMPVRILVRQLLYNSHRFDTSARLRKSRRL
jgi:hypothetical protein